MEYLIALGGNIGDTEAVFSRALEKIALLVGPVKRRSKWISSKPLRLPGAAEEQRDYLNGVIAVESALSPREVLQILHRIESDLGRNRGHETARWEARVIDLDLIAAEGLVLDTDELVVPHPEMQKRHFVLEPLLEVAPDWRHPLFHKSVRELHEELVRRQSE